MTIPSVITSIFCTLFLTLSTFGQPPSQVTSKIRNEVAYEGITLFQLETLVQASADYIWDNADMRSLKGYVAYKEGNTFHCIYWNGAYDNLEVMHSFSTDDPEDPTLLRVTNSKRAMTPVEQKYYDMKMQALTYIKGDSEMFKAPDGLRLNINFIKANDRIKGYVMPYTVQDSLIPLGNDYIINFTKGGELIDYEVIHSDFQEIDVTKLRKDPDGTIKTVQSLNEDQVPHISQTEICNLLLYSPYHEAHEHYVVSSKFVSIFNLKDRYLIIKPL
jgi:hypothetical protein